MPAKRKRRYIMFAHLHDLILGNACSSNTFNVRNGYVTHDFPGYKSHSTIPVLGVSFLSYRSVRRRSPEHPLLDEHTVSEYGIRTAHSRGECVDISHREHRYESQDLRSTGETLDDSCGSKTVEDHILHIFHATVAPPYQ